MNRREFLKGLGTLLVLLVLHVEPHTDNLEDGHSSEDAAIAWDVAQHGTESRTVVSVCCLSGKPDAHAGLQGSDESSLYAMWCHNPNFKCVATGRWLEDVLGFRSCGYSLAAHWEDDEEVWDVVSYGGNYYRPITCYERKFMDWIRRPPLTFEEERLAMEWVMIDNRTALDS